MVYLQVSIFLLRTEAVTDSETQNGIGTEESAAQREANGAGVTPRPAERVLLRTAGRTFFLSVVVVALVLALVTLLAPYGAMRFYLDTGNTLRALQSADVYINRHADGAHTYDGRYAEVLYTASGLAVDLADEGDMRAARLADKYIKRYLAIDGIDVRNAEIDAYNLTHSVPALHPALYSVRAYLENAAYECRLLLGDVSEPATGYDIAAAAAVFSGGIGEENIGTVCVILENLSSFCASGRDIVSGEYAELYAAVREAFPRIRDFAVSLPQTGARDILRQCYYTGTVATFVSYMKETEDAQYWEDADVSGDLTIEEFYSHVLLPAYLAYYD